MRTKIGVGDAGGVVVGILLPGADDFEREQLRADVVEQDVAVGGDGGVERGGVDGLDLLLVVVERGDLLLDAGGGVVFELVVVLVQAGAGAGGGGEVEVDVGEVLVGEEVKVWRAPSAERRWAGDGVGMRRIVPIARIRAERSLRIFS